MDDKIAVFKEINESKVGFQKGMFEMDGIALSFEPGALRAAVSEAVKRKTGARSLRSIFESSMLDIMYEAPTMPDLIEVVVTEKVVRDRAKPRFKFKAKKGKKSA